MHIHKKIGKSPNESVWIAISCTKEPWLKIINPIEVSHYIYAYVSSSDDFSSFSIAFFVAQILIGRNMDNGVAESTVDPTFTDMIFENIVFKCKQPFVTYNEWMNESLLF